MGSTQTHYDQTVAERTLSVAPPPNPLEFAALPQIQLGSDRGISTQMRILDPKLDIQKEALDILHIHQIVEKHYNLGNITDISKITGGAINNSYFITTEHDGNQNRFFFRHYAAGKKLKWVRLEHEVLSHLKNRDFAWSPRLIPTTRGTTFVEEKQDTKAPDYYMMTTVLPGEARYAHENNNLLPSELESTGIVFARYHSTVATLDSDLFSPGFLPGDARMLRKISNRLLTAAELLEGVAADRSATASLLREQWDRFAAVIAGSLRKLTPGHYKLLPHLPVHADLHPGNLCFDAGSVSGLFDFDFCKIDARAYDLGIAAVFFCTNWTDDKQSDGRIDSQRLRRFVRAYQNELNSTVADIAPLTPVEKEIMPEMMQLGNCMLAYWFLRDFSHRLKSDSPYKAQEVDQEYYRCVQHRLATAHWIERDRAVLAEIFTAL